MWTDSNSFPHFRHLNFIGTTWLSVAANYSRENSGLSYSLLRMFFA